MIQFNLLPNVKLEYVKAKRNKRVTLLIASLVAGLTLIILIVLFVGVHIVQKKYSADLSKDIKTESKTLDNVHDLNKILTIQNQLNSLPKLHDQKPVATRLLGFVKQVTPAKVSIAKMNINFTDQTISITGSADAISSVNKFVDTLKFTTYNTSEKTTGSAFSSVVLAAFGKDDKGTSYSVTLKYDTVIFSNASDVTLVVPPGKITTRSETEKPDQLFQPLSNPNGVKP